MRTGILVIVTLLFILVMVTAPPNAGAQQNGMQPYAIAVDKNHMVWFTDRVLRFDPKTEKFTEFVLPKAVSTTHPKSPVFSRYGHHVESY